MGKKLRTAEEKESAARKYCLTMPEHEKLRFAQITFEDGIVAIMPWSWQWLDHEPYAITKVEEIRMSPWEWEDHEDYQIWGAYY